MKNKLIFTLFLFTFLAACNNTKPDAITTTAAATNQTECRQNPLASVYHVQRLELKEPCKTVSGAVESVKIESDGDYHIAWKLDDQYSNLINDDNIKNQHGNLVVEVIPLDQPNIPKPKKGERLRGLMY